MSTACLSINAVLSVLDGTIDSQHRDGEDGTDVTTAAPLANNVVINSISLILQHSLIKCNLLGMDTGWNGIHAQM